MDLKLELFPIYYRYAGGSENRFISDEAGLKLVTDDSDDPLSRTVGALFRDATEDNPAVEVLVRHKDGLRHFYRKYSAEVLYTPQQVREQSARVD